MSPPKHGALPSLAAEEWLRAQETQAVLKALTLAGYEARAVGGAVRNSLLQRPVKDIDIATTATPPEMIAAAHKAGLKTFETGIEHGTITIVANHAPFEVTTLRRDEHTDGRHARVAFTSDWMQDASRRDFTINALYCDGEGTLFDPLGGYGDLNHRRVRFIGVPEDRIREDYLRILRFFRFTAEYTAGEPDAAGLQASIALKSGITQLSGERRRVELLRILSTARAPAIASTMQDCGILALALGTPSNAELMARIAGLEKAGSAVPDPILRLGAASLSKPGGAKVLRDSLKLSSNEYERLARMALPDRAFDPASSETSAKAFLYRHGAQAFRDGVLLAWARAKADELDPAWLQRLTLAHRWQAPELPVRGADVLALGVPSGPEVGRILSAFEDWWIAADFPMTPALLSKRLQHMVTVTKS